MDVNNDATLELLAKQALSHAKAGADIVAPSGMIDGIGIATLHTRHFRKKGQSQFDPRTDRETEGQFESAVRFELMK